MRTVSLRSICSLFSSGRFSYQGEEGDGGGEVPVLLLTSIPAAWWFSHRSHRCGAARGQQELSQGVAGRSGGRWGTQVPMYPPHLSVAIRTAKHLYKIPPKKQPALSSKTAMASLSGASSLSFSSHCRDTGMVIRSSMNLSNATAQESTQRPCICLAITWHAASSQTARGTWVHLSVGLRS